MLTKQKWDDLLYSIRKQETVVLLGPDILSQQGEAVYNTLFARLAEERPNDILDFYREDDLFLFKQEMNKGAYVREIKKYFDRQEAPPILQQLAQIPFHIYVNAAPDLMLKNCFDHYGLKNQFRHFSPVKPEEEISEINKQNPLIYNIMGTLEGDDESIILSHDDLFRYLQSMLGERGISTALRQAFQAANELIFIGFEFNKWYVQLLLRILELDKAKFAFNRIAAGDYAGDNKVKELCVKQFNIKIIDKKPDMFVNKLFEMCQNDAKITLRPTDNAQRSQQAQQDVQAEERERVKTRIKRLMKLLTDYELELDLESDPQKKMQYEMKIEQLKEKKEAAIQELKKL